MYDKKENDILEKIAQYKHSTIGEREAREILSIQDTNYNIQDITKHYRQLMKQLHPDRNRDRTDQAQRAAQNLGRAFDILQVPLNEPNIGTVDPDQYAYDAWYRTVISQDLSSRQSDHRFKKRYGVREHGTKYVILDTSQNLSRLSISNVARMIRNQESNSSNHDQLTTALDRIHSKRGYTLVKVKVPHDNTGGLYQWHNNVHENNIIWHCDYLKSPSFNEGAGLTVYRQRLDSSAIGRGEANYSRYGSSGGSHRTPLSHQTLRAQPLSRTHPSKSSITVFPSSPSQNQSSSKHSRLPTEQQTPTVKPNLSGYDAPRKTTELDERNPNKDPHTESFKKALAANVISLFFIGTAGAFSISHQFSMQHDLSFTHLTPGWHGSNLVYPFQVTLWDVWLGVGFLLYMSYVLARHYHNPDYHPHTRKIAIRAFTILPILVLFGYWGGMSSKLPTKNLAYVLNTCGIHIITPVLLLIAVHYFNQYLTQNHLLKEEKLSEAQSYLKWLRTDGKWHLFAIFGIGITFWGLSGLCQSLTSQPIYSIVKWNMAGGKNIAMSAGINFSKCMAISLFALTLLYMVGHKNRAASILKVLTFSLIPAFISKSLIGWVITHQMPSVSHHVGTLASFTAGGLAFAVFATLLCYRYRNELCNHSEPLESNKDDGSWESTGTISYRT